MSTDRAVVAAVAEALPAESETEQLDLLDPDQVETESGKRRVVVHRGPGRPKGARNKRTERTLRWLMAHHKDPREVLLAVADMHPADLAAMLGCKAIEALQEIRLCAAAVLPFVAQKQPLAIDLTSRSVVYLTINEGGQVAPAGGVGLAAQILDLQPLSDEPPARLGQDGLGQEGEDADPHE